MELLNILKYIISPQFKTIIIKIVNYLKNTKWEKYNEYFEKQEYGESCN